VAKDPVMDAAALKRPSILHQVTRSRLTPYIVAILLFSVNAAAGSEVSTAEKALRATRPASVVATGQV